jgi:hypothetical protein
MYGDISNSLSNNSILLKKEKFFRKFLTNSFNFCILVSMKTLSQGVCIYERHSDILFIVELAYHGIGIARG